MTAGRAPAGRRRGRRSPARCRRRHRCRPSPRGRTTTIASPAARGPRRPPISARTVTSMPPGGRRERREVELRTAHDRVDAGPATAAGRSAAAPRPPMTSTRRMSVDVSSPRSSRRATSRPTTTSAAGREPERQRADALADDGVRRPSGSWPSSLPRSGGPSRAAAPCDHPGVSDERETLTYELFDTAIRELAEQVADDGYEPAPDPGHRVAAGLLAGALGYAAGASRTCSR